MCLQANVFVPGATAKFFSAWGEQKKLLGCGLR